MTRAWGSAGLLPGLPSRRMRTPVRARGGMGSQNPPAAARSSNASAPRPHISAIAWHERALAAQALERYDEAEHAAQQALSLIEQSETHDPADAANVLNVLGSLACRQHGYAEAAAYARRAWRALNRSTSQPGGQYAGAVRQETLNLFGASLRAAGHYAEAELWLRRALDHAVLSNGDLLPSLNNLAVLYKCTGDFDRAAALYQRALRAAPPNSLNAATVHHNLGGLAHARGHYAEGAHDALRAWEIRRSILGADHPDTLADWCAYAALLDGLKRFHESEPIYRHTLEAFERTCGPAHPQIGVVLNNLAVLRWRLGDWVDAEQLYRRAIAVKGVCFGADHPDTALTLYNYASFLTAAGRAAAAKHYADEALPILEHNLTPAHPTLRAVRTLVRSLSQSLRQSN